MNKGCKTSEAFHLDRLFKDNENFQRERLCIGQM